jgi:putative peptidoglycan lipid II flippase
MQSEISEEELVSPEPASITQPAGSAAMARAAGVIALGNVTSRILGLARETVKSHLFGATWRVDAFQVSAVVPTQLYELLIGGMISSALVPIFSEYADRREELGRLAGTLFTLAAVSFAVLVLLAEGLASLIAWLLGSGFDVQTQSLASDLLRITLPAVMFLSLSGLLTGLLYALKRFTYPAFTAAVFNATVVVAAVLFRTRLGVASMAIGILAGGIVQIALQAPGLRGLNLRLSIDWHHPALRRIFRLYIPVAVSLIISQVAIYLSYNLASHAGEGSIAWMNYATTLIQFPLGLVATAISVAILPTLSRQSQEAINSEQAVTVNRAFLTTLAHGLKLVLMLMIPATIGLFVLAQPIVALVFQHGEFTAQDTAATAQILRFYLFGLTFAAIDQPLVFAFYACKDTRTPALVGLACIGIYLAAALAPTLFRPLHVADLALANSIQWICHALIMLWLLRQRLGGLSGYGVQTLIAKALGAALAMGGVAALIAWALTPVTRLGFTLGHIIIVGGAGAIAVLVYAILMVALRVEELGVLRQLVTGRA